MDDNNYVKFVKDCNYITNCQKMQYLELNRNISKIDNLTNPDTDNPTNQILIYKPVKSNLQIFTYVKYSHQDIMRMAKLKLLFNHFFTVKQIGSKVIKKIKISIANDTHITDSKIIKLISKYKKMDKYIEMKAMIKQRAKDTHVRAVCSQYKYIFEYIGLKHRQLFRNYKIRDIRYLDFGCGFSFHIPLDRSIYTKLDNIFRFIHRISKFIIYDTRSMC
jgi:hypothetical protein